MCNLITRTRHQSTFDLPHEHSEVPPRVSRFVYQIPEIRWGETPGSIEMLEKMSELRFNWPELELNEKMGRGVR